jgi:hypothetical protein
LQGASGKGGSSSCWRAAHLQSSPSRAGMRQQLLQVPGRGGSSGSISGSRAGADGERDVDGLVLCIAVANVMCFVVGHAVLLE